MKTVDHIVLDCKDPIRKWFLCTHCGAREPLSLPVSIHQFSLLSQDFLKRHRRCPAPRPVSADPG